MRVRKVVVLALSLSLAFTLSACGAGRNAQTGKITQVTDGVDGTINTSGSYIKVRSFLLVAQPDGSAVVVGSMFNELTGPEDLLAISVGDKIATLSKTTYPLTANIDIMRLCFHRKRFLRYIFRNYFLIDTFST